MTIARDGVGTDENEAGPHRARDRRVSRADALKVAGGSIAGLILSSDVSIAVAESTAVTHIVRCAIYPPIGIARGGNSPTDFFVGPEVPGVSTNSGGQYKDRSGRVKRQAARFRIYGLNAAGQVVKELTTHDADITWTAHLANKKAAWYKHKIPLDLPEAAFLRPEHLCRRRNKAVTGAARHHLVIDPGPRSIRGTNVQGTAYHFDSGSFHGKHVPVLKILR